jgi:hypothetical protein
MRNGAFLKQSARPAVDTPNAVRGFNTNKSPVCITGPTASLGRTNYNGPGQVARTHARQQLLSAKPACQTRAVTRCDKPTLGAGWMMHNANTGHSGYLAARRESMPLQTNPLKHNGNYTFHLLQQPVTNTSFLVCVFRTTLTVNSDYFLKQR